LGDEIWGTYKGIPLTPEKLLIDRKIEFYDDDNYVTRYSNWLEFAVTDPVYFEELYPLTAEQLLLDSKLRRW
jgi:hypothetical protein